MQADASLRGAAAQPDVAAETAAVAEGARRFTEKLRDRSALVRESAIKSPRTRP